MKFYYGSGRLCLDFVRTIRARRGVATEGLEQPTDLQRWVSEALPQLPRLEECIGEAQLESARNLREVIYRSIDTARTGAHLRDSDIELLNRYAAQPLAFPQLLKNGKGVYLASSSVLAHAFAQLARDAIELIASENISRVRECADKECTSLFLDTSRSSNRKWCSAMPCANRQKVRNYRSRIQASGDKREPD
jgi:predicted RNA-binding Zn ribbon-like protein